MKKNKIFIKGMRDGFPIGMGYFAVSVALGIIAKKGGLTSVLAFISSFFVRASAGEFSGYTLMAENASYFSVALMCIITNLRYLLMSTALTQKFEPGTPWYKRILAGVCVTDEIFGISIAYEGLLDPVYMYGATVVAGTMWASGTVTGIILGSILPWRAVSALNVALFGMFMAVFVPAAKKDRAVLLSVIASFILSFVFAYAPLLKDIFDGGSRTIILTILIAAVAAILKPVDMEDAA